MCKTLSIDLALASLMLAAGTMIMIDQVSAEPNKFEKAAAAKVSIDEAIATARENVSGTVIEVELDQNHDRLIWEIKVITPQKQTKEIHIDAQTGTVIDVNEEKVKSKQIRRRN